MIVYSSPPHKRNENYGNIKRVKIRLAVSNSVRHTDNTIHANEHTHTDTVLIRER